METWAGPVTKPNGDLRDRPVGAHNSRPVKNSWQLGCFGYGPRISASRVPSITYLLARRCGGENRPSAAVGPAGVQPHNGAQEWSRTTSASFRRAPLSDDFWHILRYGRPHDARKKATQVVLKQAITLSTNWSTERQRYEIKFPRLGETVTIGANGECIPQGILDSLLVLVRGLLNPCDRGSNRHEFCGAG